jgi:hypothetical protein
MKTKVFKAPNPQWDITEFTCDKTGISIQKYSMNIEPGWSVFKIKENDKHYDIMEDVFEIIKKLIV